MKIETVKRVLPVFILIEFALLGLVMMMFYTWRRENDLLEQQARFYIGQEQTKTVGVLMTAPHTPSSSTHSTTALRGGASVRVYGEGEGQFFEDCLSCLIDEAESIRAAASPVVAEWARLRPHIEPEIIEDIVLDMYSAYSAVMAAEQIDEEDIPFEWLMAQMIVESKGDILAVGQAGEIGLFQILPRPAKVESLRAAGLIETVDDLFDPATNCAAATYTLIWMYRNQDGDLKNATAYYNAGNNIRAGENYVKKVQKIFSAFYHAI